MAKAASFDWSFHLGSGGQELQDLQFRVAYLEKLVRTRARSFGKLFHKLESLLLNNAAMLMFDDLIRMSDERFDHARELVAEMHSIGQLFLVSSVLVPKPGPAADGPLMTIFARLLEQASAPDYPVAETNRDLALVEILETAVAVGYGTMAPNGRQPLTRLVCKADAEEASLRALAAIGAGVFDAVGYTERFVSITESPGAAVTSDDLRALGNAVEIITSFLHRLGEESWTLRHEISRQERVCAWLLSDLGQLVGSPRGHESAVAIAARGLGARQLEALHGYSLLLGLRYRFARASERGGVEANRILEKVHRYAPSQFTMADLCRYWCVLQSYSERMRGAVFADRAVV